MSAKYRPRAVAITGAVGNLATKLIDHLIQYTDVPRIVGLDIVEPSPERQAQIESLLRATAAQKTPPTIDFVTCDLTDWQDRRWRDALQDVEAVVHFAARNPYPEATWDEVGASLDMTLHIAQAAADSSSVDRFVFATSNHVMGRYKDAPLAALTGPGELRADSEPGVGTVWHTGVQWMDSTPYATAKFAGERLCRSLAERGEGQTTFVAIRIGWCQPGENRPETLSASGSPTLELGTLPPDLDPTDFDRSDRWFRGMWLSNRDFVQIFEKAIGVEAENWPSPFVLVNGMSANRGMKWSLAEARTYLGYEAVDDVYAE
ncbi:MAG: NAD(P)-dependent oxidoreductase [Caldilineaceae bacterium]